MRYVYILATLCALAFQPAFADEVNKVGTTPDEVDRQLVYDIGIAPTQDDEATTVAVAAPEGKADKLVVLGAVWCGPCQTLKATTIASLKLQGYKIETYDIDKDLEELHKKYSNIKRGSGAEVNYWNSVPTIFYIRGDTIIRKDVGYVSAVHVRQILWKPSDDEEASAVEKVRRRFPWNR